MKIACLQFAPRVGDVHNNLDRAEAVLNNGEPLDELDLLVLPELAFTGYNFQSLAEISPCLELSGSGISALWARTVALKLGCHVVVGYPEKVDVAHKWPTSPEFYNAALIVSRDGDRIGNYRKSFLYTVDEKWALEGQDGFFEGEIDGLGNVAMGICMDINPYKFEAPWNAFEFAFHVLKVKANLVIITMAWLTSEEPGSFSQLPQEPDLHTLEYWVQRLEPVIRTGSSEEIIVVFCNRAGAEGAAYYAGTSAVVGIRNGEVSLYGVLGRGVEELLVVDTSRKPFAKLVRVSDNNGQVSMDSESMSSGQQHPGTLPKPSAPSIGLSEQDSSLPAVGSSKDLPADGSDMSRKGLQAGTTGTIRSPTLSKIQLPDLTLQIPNSMISPTRKTRKSPTSSARPGAPITRLAGENDIHTPTAPSPTPLSMRPKLPFSEARPRFPSANDAILSASSRSRPSFPKPIAETPPSPPSDDAMGLSHLLSTGGPAVDGLNKTPRKQETKRPPRESVSKQVDSVPESSVAYTPVRPPSSRNASHVRRTESVEHLRKFGGRSNSRSQMATPPVASSSMWTPQSDRNRRGSETPYSAQPERRPRMWAATGQSGAEDVPSRQPSRPVSRGRQPFEKRNATNGMVDIQQWANAVANRVMENQEQQPSNRRPVQSVDRAGTATAPLRQASASGMSRTLSASRLLGTASPMQTHPPMDPDDGIIAVINRAGNQCLLHNTTAGQSGSVPPQPGQQRRQSQQPQQEPQLPRQQSMQRPGSVATAHARHRSASGAPRRPDPSQSASVPPLAAQDGIHELILPPHIRELVENMTTPGLQDPFLSRGLERRVKTVTPKKFNPPTPTAMKFPADNDKSPA